jgi:hypothetical protein
MQEIILELQLAQEQAQEAAQEPKQDQGLKYHFEDLYDAERANLGDQEADYQQQVDELTEMLENRSRIAVFWDKLRGRVGWNAELELEAARQQLEETQERAEALELSYAQQREVEEERSREQEQQAERERQMQDYIDRFKEAEERNIQQDKGRDKDIDFGR